MSFPDPHHPWDPPQDEVGRIDWRDVPLPAGYPDAADDRERILDDKPRHWRLWYDGTLVSNYEAPAEWVPATLTADQVREVNARNAVECELIDEALGRVLARIDERGWGDDVDVVFTTDHGELQGDFGLLFKGPYHVDALMRLPLVWRPARTHRQYAGRDPEPGRPRRPRADVLLDRRPRRARVDAGTTVAGGRRRRRRPRVRTGAHRVGQRAVRRRRPRPHDHPRRLGVLRLPAGTVHDGTEGELYDLDDDPLQRRNRWDDPALPVTARRSPRRPVGQPVARPTNHASSSKLRCSRRHDTVHRPQPRHRRRDDDLPRAAGAAHHHPHQP